ncbi:MAG TPA: hypothetical protein VK181_04550 [Rhizobium sp.]|nr:hypothetical protein [Rhizobium sp.]
MKKVTSSQVDYEAMAAEEALETFVPAATFDAYPDGKKTHFVAGKESHAVPASFVNIMRAKGLVR